MKEAPRNQDYIPLYNIEISAEGSSPIIKTLKEGQRGEVAHSEAMLKRPKWSTNP